MAAKFALAASLLVALIGLAAATTYTTTIVTTSAEDESNQQQFRQCQQQLQGRPFRSCQRYLSQRNPFNGEEEDVASLEEDDEEANQQQGALMECCRELRNVNPPCQCAAIRQAVRQLQRERGSYGEMGQMQTVSVKARNLPQRCGLPVRQCQIRAIVV